MKNRDGGGEKGDGKNKTSNGRRRDAKHKIGKDGGNSGKGFQGTITRISPRLKPKRVEEA